MRQRFANRDGVTMTMTMGLSGFRLSSCWRTWPECTGRNYIHLALLSRKGGGVKGRRNPRPFTELLLLVTSQSSPNFSNM